MGVSVHTVRKQLSMTFDKTGLRNQSELSGFLTRMTQPTHGKTSTAYLK
jgi:DNA-binding CsgD family transcriptional regulator